MAKRSPILGYNHNVRYRGLVFHVQTEDSGVLSPHLFTHLFHHGVIVSTRKLVYDSGSAEDSIKSLMQAQHKAVLKDLKHGAFDDKIDQYLGGTPGLLPRDLPADEVLDLEPTDPDQPTLLRSGSSHVPSIRPEPGVGATLTEAELMLSREPTIEHPSITSRPTEPAVGPAEPALTLRPTEPAVGPAEPALTLRPTEPAVGPVEPALTLRPTEQGGPPGVATVAHNNHATEDEIELPSDLMIDESPEILIQLELDEPDERSSPRTRKPRDTDVAAPIEQEEPSRQSRPVLDASDGIPGVVTGGGTLRTGGELIPPLSVTERMGADTGPLDSSRGRRASTAVGAATLPPARPITRPPNRAAMAPPQVISRPLPPNERRSQETDAIEVYAPAPPSAELPGAPAGAAGERPGQYSQHKRASERIPTELGKEARRTPAPGVPIPAGAGRQSRPAMQSGVTPTTRPATPPPIPQPRNAESTPRGVDPASRSAESAPRSIESAPRSPDQTSRNPDQTFRNPDPAPRSVEPAPLRSPTPPRVANPAASRTPASAAGGANNSGVVMTRPAVIVGAPSKPITTTQRIRKAREDEGRGFGQGLISEKSLDEVILAYLSEDADDK